MQRRVSSSEFVGRVDELAALEAAVAGAARATPSLTLVLGEGGIGKSRLVREATTRAAEAGALVLRGQCVDLSGGELPYAPIGAALHGAHPAALSAALEELSPEASTELGRVFPDLVADTPSAAGQPVPQSRLFTWLLALLRNLSDAVPLLLVLEDVHWADASTRDFLRHLVRSMRDEHLAVVATVRSDDLHRDHPLRPVVAELYRDEHVQQLHLVRLTPAEVELQLAGILDEAPPPELVARMFARAEGNPFYVEELLAAGADAPAELPATLRDILLLHVDGLSPEARELVAVLATAGQPVDDELLAACLAAEPRDVAGAARQALDRNVLIREADGLVTFRHALLREAVYAELQPAERVAHHAAIAGALEARGDAGTAAARAHHWAAAGVSGPAYAASVEAALAAERVYAYGEALVHFERALGLPPAPAALEPVEVPTHAAEAARWTGDYERARTLCEEALASFAHDAEPERAAALYERLGSYQPWNTEAALAAYRRALELLPAARSPERARLLGREALALTFMGRWEEACTQAETALEVAQEVGAVADEGSARAVHGVALAFLGDLEGGEAELRRALGPIAAAGTAEDLGRVQLDLGETLRLQGRLEEALELMLEGEQAAVRLGTQRSFGTFLAVNAAGDLLRLGRWDEADARLRELGRQRLGPTGELLCATIAGRLATARGRLDEGAELFERAQSLWREGRPAEFLPALYAGWAELELWRGRPDEARGRIEDGLRGIGGADDSLHAPSLYSMGARVEADLAEHDRSARTAGAAERLLSSLQELLGSHAPPPETAAHLASCRAETARAAGQAAPDAWAEAVACWELAGQPYPTAYSRRRHAEALLLAGAPKAEARRALSLAYAAATHLRAAPLAADLRALARRARLDLEAEETKEVADERPAGLTEREVEVLRLLADGLTNREIAERLFISQKTAGVHVSHILQKLQAPNRLVAAATARNLGVLPAEPAPRPG